MAMKFSPSWNVAPPGGTMSFHALVFRTLDERNLLVEHPFRDLSHSSRLSSKGMVTYIRLWNHIPRRLG